MQYDDEQIIYIGSLIIGTTSYVNLKIISLKITNK